MGWPFREAVAPQSNQRGIETEEKKLTEQKRLRPQSNQRGIET